MIEIDGFVSFTLAVMLLLTGKLVIMRSRALQRYSIPEAVAGGLICVAVIGLAYGLFDVRVQFDLAVRDFLLLLFFAGVGLQADVGALLRGGRPLAVLLGLAVVFILIQNLAGMSMAAAFGMSPLAGLMTGSVSLTGGMGTTLAWAPILEARHGIANAAELGAASNMIGLIAACVIGGPMALFLIRRHGVRPSEVDDLPIGAANDAVPTLDYFGMLWAILALNAAVLLGMGLNALLGQVGVTAPTFLSCLVAGILLRNLTPYALGDRIRLTWPGVGQGLALISDLSLGLFLVMALMGLQIWSLGGVMTFILATLAVQVALTVLYVLFVVFRLMGRDYEAVVISAAFGGITLGSTATAIANMTAVTQQYGAAPRAFIIVPLVCGFFIDIANVLAISAFVG